MTQNSPEIQERQPLSNARLGSISPARCGDDAVFGAYRHISRISSRECYLAPAITYRD